MSADYYLLDELLTPEARDVRDRVRTFVDTELLPVINDYWDRAEFPFPLVPKIAELGIIGSTIAQPTASTSRRPLGFVPSHWATKPSAGSSLTESSLRP